LLDVRISISVLVTDINNIFISDANVLEIKNVGSVFSFLYPETAVSFFDFLFFKN